LSRVSTIFSASVGLSGGKPLDDCDCSAQSVVETMKGMSRDSTPSFTRSSAAIGGSGSPHQWTMIPTTVSSATYPVSFEFHQTCRPLSRRERRGAEVGSRSVGGFPGNILISTPRTCTRGVVESWCDRRLRAGETATGVRKRFDGRPDCSSADTAPYNPL